MTPEDRFTRNFARRLHKRRLAVALALPALIALPSSLALALFTDFGPGSNSLFALVAMLSACALLAQTFWRRRLQRARDIAVDKRRRLQHRLRFARTILQEHEDRVRAAERTAHHAAERERAAEGASRETEARSKARNSYLATVSHEIRTPMNGILGMAQLLLDGELPQEQRMFAETIHGSASALLDLINDLLDLSRMEEGRLTIAPVEMDPRKLCDDVLRSLMPKAIEKGLELKLQVHPALPRLLIGDPLRIRQVLTNLVGNALKFTSEGSVTVLARAARLHGDRVHLRIDVVDTGIGIPRDRQESIFERFRQADASTARQFGGSGLGLAISRQLCVLMGGVLDLDSEPGRGSRFGFELPLERAAPSRDEALDAAPLEGTEALVVDPCIQGRIRLVARLARFGMRAAVAETLDEALALLRERLQQGTLPAFALMHGSLLGGGEANRAARQIESDPALRNLARIALHPRSRPVECDPSALAATLPRPLEPGALLEALLVGLQRAQGQTSKRSGAPAPLFENNCVRVLLAEDDPVNQRVAVHMLRRLGLQVDVAVDGRRAVEAFAQAEYALVLMDCQMPELDGYAATRELRRRFPQSRVPIVALTANAMTGVKDECLAAGMDDFLTKPIEWQVLRDVLERNLIPQR